MLSNTIWIGFGNIDLRSDDFFSKANVPSGHFWAYLDLHYLTGGIPVAKSDPSDVVSTTYPV